MMHYTVYILRTSSNTLYTGYTTNIEKRMQEHRDKKGRGSKYIRAFTDFTPVHTEEFATKSEAMKREAAIKKLSRKEKEELIRACEFLNLDQID